MRLKPMLATLAATLLGLATPAAAQTTALTGATLIDGTGAPARPHQDILVKGERIVAVAPHGGIADARDARRVDLAGRFIIPGIIDSHVHLATPPDMARARAILRRNLYGGVTAVRDMADDLRAVGELSREALAAEIPSPDIYYAAVMAGPPFFKDPRVAAISFGSSALIRSTVSMTLAPGCLKMTRNTPRLPSAHAARLLSSGPDMALPMSRMRNGPPLR